MANQQNKGQWIDEVLNSTSGMAKAQPADGLFGRISHKLNNKQATYLSIPIKQWAVAAMLLLMLNIGSVIYFTANNKKAARATGNPLTAEMQLESTYNY
jgi:hypothetical protein